MFTLPNQEGDAEVSKDDDRGRDKDRRSGNYFTVKGGYIDYDEGSLGDGVYLGGSTGRYFTRLLSFEFEGGYTDSEGTRGGVKTELNTVPLMVNGRISLPIWFLEIYGGVGIGGIYYDADSRFAGFGNDRDGWVLGGQGFLGADIALFDTLTGGLELRYQATEEIRNTSTDLNALSLLATLGLRF